MRIILVALMIALFATPAHARGKRGSGAQHQSSADQQKKSLAEEKAYKDALEQNSQSEAGRSLGQDAIDGARYSTLPGLRMPFGSSVRLSVFISS